MRSLLFVPADSEKKLSKVLAAGADALILDLEDLVAHGNKPLARDLARAFLESHASKADRPLLIVRVNALDLHMVNADLDAVVAASPDAIMLPKSESGVDVAGLDEKLTSREATHGMTDGHIKIMVVATETAKAVFNLGSYQRVSPRLNALMGSGRSFRRRRLGDQPERQGTLYRAISARSFALPVRSRRSGRRSDRRGFSGLW